MSASGEGGRYRIENGQRVLVHQTRYDVDQAPAKPPKKPSKKPSASSKKEDN